MHQKPAIGIDARFSEKCGEGLDEEGQDWCSRCANGRQGAITPPSIDLDGEVPTFYKPVTAHVGWNEIRSVTTADHLPPPPPAPAGRVPGFSLQGAIPVEATAGNAWAEWPPKNTSSPR